MADTIDLSEATADEFVAMAGETLVVEIDEPIVAENASEVGAIQEEVIAVPARITYIDYLKSPTVGLLVGQGKHQALLTAHQALLVLSPFFAEKCAHIANGGSHQIDLIDEDLDAVGCFLEYMYTGDYFPRKITGSRDLEHDPTSPAVDESGEQLLKHARVYTLANKLQLPDLRSLASSKIHCVSSTAKGEIEYARYVYAHTLSDDKNIRAPVVNFWAARSHTLRSEAEDEFKMVCLEFPQFGYDVLTRVLDEKLKKERNEKVHPSTSHTPGTSRKRPRQSAI